MSKRDRVKSAAAYARHRAILVKTSRLIESRIGKMPQDKRTCVYENDDAFGNPIDDFRNGRILCPFAETCLRLEPSAEVLCEASDEEAEIDWLKVNKDKWHELLGPNVRFVADILGPGGNWGKLAKKPEIRKRRA